MIETKILDAAVGIQRQDVIDKSETTPLPSLANGVIAGHFKRGRMDKPFKVTASNYKALLGYDPSNPSYLAVEDAFKRGISEVSILRTGSITSGGGDNGDTTTSKLSYIEISSRSTPSLFGEYGESGNVAACLKIQVGSNNPEISSFVTARFALNKRDATPEQAAINFLFQKIASGVNGNPWGYMSSQETIGVPERAGLLAANFGEGYTGSEKTSVTLIALDESYMRAMAFKFVGTPYWEFETVPFDELQAYVNANLSLSYIDNRIEITHDPSLITISRCTQAEIDSLVEGEHPPHIDMFDYVKSLLSVQNPMLNNEGFAPAIYNAEKDVIGLLPVVDPGHGLPGRGLPSRSLCPGHRGGQ